MAMESVKEFVRDLHAEDHEETVPGRPIATLFAESCMPRTSVIS